MQFLIDTATDSPTELYKIGRFLVDQFEAVSVPAQDLTEKELAPRVVFHEDGSPSVPPPPVPFMPPLPPQFPGTSDDVIGDNDPEIEIDNDGSITSVTVSTELPPPPPPLTARLPADWNHNPPPAMPAPPGPAVPAELDSRGMPWDARIHASNRSKTIKNEWKRKRGVDDNLVTACEAQNKPGNVPSIAAAPIVSAVSVPAVAAVNLAPPPPPVSFAPPLPPLPPVSAGIAAPAAVAPSAPVIDFRGLMQKIQAASAAGKLTPDQVNAALAGVGLKPEEMAQLINNAPLIASVNAAVDRCLT